jgi:large subunit ribosomal protein L31
LLGGPAIARLSGYAGSIISLPGNSLSAGVRVKANIHPQYRPITVQCACGNTFETRTTAASVHVEVCSVCHPYFTGKQRLMDTAGRVDRFRRKYAGTPAAGAAKE